MNILNIDDALFTAPKDSKVKDWKLFHTTIDALLAKQEEVFQRDNPLNKLFRKVTMDTWQKTFISTVRQTGAFREEGDHSKYALTTGGGRVMTVVTYRIFQGGKMFTWQYTMEATPEMLTEDIRQWKVAWDDEFVSFGMATFQAMLGTQVKFTEADAIINPFYSEDTINGLETDQVHNLVFTNRHTVVRQDGMTTTEFNRLMQSNKFYVDIKLDGSDPLAYAKLANALSQISTGMENLRDNGGHFTGVKGKKLLVAANNAHIKTAIRSVLEEKNFTIPNGGATPQTIINQIQDQFDSYFTPYFEDATLTPAFATDPTVGHPRGILMVNPSYNAQNNGLMMVERRPFRMQVVTTTDPMATKYLADHLFNFACPSWRGVAYIYIGKPAGNSGDWDDPTTFTEIVPVAMPQAVTIVGPVTTQNP